MSIAAIGLKAIQWNPPIMATIGTKDFGHYRGVATNQGFYKYYFNAVGTKVNGHYSGVAIKGGSTVVLVYCISPLGVGVP